jgi:hypothetical protein
MMVNPAGMSRRLKKNLVSIFAMKIIVPLIITADRIGTIGVGEIRIRMRVPIPNESFVTGLI